MEGSIVFKLHIEEALRLARQAAQEDEVPVGAVVVRRLEARGHDGELAGDPEYRIVGRGYNRREQDSNPVAHAEILAVMDAARELQSWRLTGCLLVVTLEPCPMCLAACQQARLDQVIYGAQDLKGGALSLNYNLHQDLKTNHRFGVLHEPHPECGRILKDFFSKKRKG